MVLKVDQPAAYVLTVTLDRPQVRNALNPELIAALSQTFSQIPAATRAVVLQATGSTFCAGADLNWMRDSLAQPLEVVEAEAQSLADMLQTVQQCPCPVIAAVQGNAFGGAIGLLAACDVVISHPDSCFCLSETRLGLIPAIIAPWVSRKMGFSAFNALTLTAQVVDAVTAQRFNLVHMLAQDPASTALAQAEKITQLGPKAVMMAKHTLNQLHPITPTISLVDVISRCRQSEEGQEGMRAFLEKRSPNWCKPE
jgi:methylglutaconyl-CoA hydratase